MTAHGTDKLITYIRELEDLRRGLPGLLQNLAEGEIVALGHKLGAIAKEAAETLDPIKVLMRNKGVLSTGGDSGTCHFNGSDGSHCTVSVPKPTTVVRKDADMVGLQQFLGDDFHKFFETVTVYKPKGERFSTRVASTDSARRDAVLNVVDVKEGTPRVSFK